MKFNPMQQFFHSAMKDEAEKIKQLLKKTGHDYAMNYIFQMFLNKIFNK